jgi:hypothetical protein
MRKVTVSMIGLGLVIVLDVAGAALASAHTGQGSATPGNDGHHPWPTNGCGPGGFGRLVPDKVIGIYNFNHACDHHDGCYAGFPKSGKPTYWVTRRQCDTWFLYDMQNSCRWRHGSNPSRTWAGRRCLDAADDYHWAVRAHGRSSYKGPGSKNN